MLLEPGEHQVTDDETPLVTREERASFLARAAAIQAAQYTCPICGLLNPIGRLACLRCQSDLADREITCNVGLNLPQQRTKSHPVGEVFISDQDAICFEIGSVEHSLPFGALLTVGRQTTVTNLTHVDLTSYDAWEKGVSRKHIEIRRKNKLLYIVDLGATNGTILNGRRLIPHTEYLLRSGDQLELSRLSIKVRF
jgi:hypothetical protein